MTKACGNCGEESHRYVDCPYVEGRIRKADWEELKQKATLWDEHDFEYCQDKKLKEEILSLAIISIRGQGYYRFTNLIGVENKFDMEQFITDDGTTDIHWNVSWLAVTLQELWNKPIIQKILKQGFKK